MKQKSRASFFICYYSDFASVADGINLFIQRGGKIASFFPYPEDTVTYFTVCDNFDIMQEENAIKITKKLFWACVNTSLHKQALLKQIKKFYAN